MKSSFYYYYWFWIFSFLLLLIINTGSYFQLKQIKKLEFPNLWEKDEMNAKWWTPAEKIFLYEINSGKPRWIEDNKNARIWFFLYRVSEILIITIWVAPLIYIFGKYYLLDNGN